MMVLTREILLSRQILNKEKVALRDGGYVYVREMTAREKDNYERLIIEIDEDGNIKRKQDNFRAKLAVCTVCDEDGKLLFTPEDVDQLSESLIAVDMETIVSAAQSINNMGRDVEKNLTATPENSSSFD